MATCENDNDNSTRPLFYQVNLGETEEMSVACESHLTGLMKGLHAHFKDQRFCDVKLVFGKKEIEAHKVVLASFSQYFEAMFSSNFIDGEQQRLEIKGVGESVGEALIEFAYSGKIKITAENITEILAGANFLQGFEAVEKSCCDYLQKYSSKINVFQILEIADHYHQSDLKQAMSSFSRRNFVDCVDNDHDAFLNLHEDLLKELISAEELVIANNMKVYLGREQEEYLLEKAIEYLEYNEKHGVRVSTEEILKCVRLPLLKKQFLHDLKKNKLFSNKKCVTVIENALKAEKVKKKCEETTPPSDSWTRKRACGEYQLWKGRCLASTGHVNNIVETFDDSSEICKEEDYLKGMELWIRQWDGRPVIGGIKVHYSNGKSVTHGSDKADQKEEFTLEPNERIVKIDSQSGWMIDNLTLYTNKERKLGPFGGSGGGFRHEAPPQCHGYLAYINGTVVDSQNDLGITKLQFVWRLFRMPGEVPAKDYQDENYYDMDDDNDDDDDYSGYSDYEDYDDYDEYDEYEDYDDYDDYFDDDPYRFDPIADYGPDFDPSAVLNSEVMEALVAAAAAAQGSGDANDDNGTASKNLDKEVD